MTEHLLSLPKGTEVEVRAPVYKIHGEDYEYLFEQIRVNGYRRAQIDGKPRDLGDHIELDEDESHSVEAVIDSFVVGPGIDQQVVTSLEHGLKLGDGLLELRGGNIGKDSEWIRTNDLALLDPDNFLWIKGRHDGAIIRGGFKIFPDDVTKALETHPAVREAAATGMPDERLGQAVHLIVRPAQGISDAEEELPRKLMQELPNFMQPKVIHWRTAMPISPNGKLDRTGLYQELRTGAGT